jgi:hypothetical protein
MNNKKRCHHGYEIGPNGEHIIPKNTAIPMNEAARLYTNDRGEPPIVVHRTPPQTEEQKAFQASVNKWKKYFEQNKGKIHNTFPKTIFDNELNKQQQPTNNNEVKKLSKLLEDAFDY